MESKEERELKLQRELLAWVEAYGIGTHRIAIKHRDDIGRWMVAAEARSSERPKLRHSYLITITETESPQECRKFSVRTLSTGFLNSFHDAVNVMKKLFLRIWCSQCHNLTEL